MQVNAIHNKYLLMMGVLIRHDIKNLEYIDWVGQF
jgi:hypothetical protein